MNSRFIANVVEDMIKADPAISLKELTAFIETRYGHTPNYIKMWNAKNKAIANVFGDWTMSYWDLSRFLCVVRDHNRGTVFEIEKKPINEEHFYFDRLFVAFDPCINAFRHCRPVVSVDATHLYGKHKGKMYIALGVDANQMLLALAFMVGEEFETTDSWTWFLARVRHYCVGNREGVCLISDRHLGIKAAVRNEATGWTPPYGYHHYCLRHLCSNFKNAFKNQILKQMLWKAASQNQLCKFDRIMNQIGEISVDAWNWLLEEPVDMGSFRTTVDIAMVL